MAAVRRKASTGSGRSRFVRICAAAMLACAGAAQAQFVGSLALANQNRYRGVATEDVGPVLRASAMADASFGAYAGVSGLWRTRDAALANAEAIVGWSGRLNDIPALSGIDPAWGWDVAWHRTHYGESSRYDFSEGMAGLLAPGWSARLWWAPHYFGSDWSSLYGEVNASRDIAEHWRVFAHIGTLRYGPGNDGYRPAGRTDAMLGAAWVADDWDLRLARDGLVAGHAFGALASRRREAGWLLSTSVAF